MERLNRIFICYSLLSRITKTIERKKQRIFQIALVNLMWLSQDLVKQNISVGNLTRINVLVKLFIFQKEQNCPFPPFFPLIVQLKIHGKLNFAKI